eukprot:5908014-Pyramimonas_sp.AAC.1
MCIRDSPPLPPPPPPPPPPNRHPGHVVPSSSPATVVLRLVATAHEVQVVPDRVNRLAAAFPERL